MDKLTLLGLLVAIVGVMTGQILEGSNIAMLFQGTAFMIVFGGTLGAVMVQSSTKVFAMSLKMGVWAFIPPKTAGPELIEQIVILATLARKEGILALEVRIPDIGDAFLQKGLQLVVDGQTAEKIQELLDIDTQCWEQLRWQGARVWEAAAGYSPTVGIIGAVLGLMHVMQNLSEPAKLGGGIAVAFVATIYGVSFANFILLPIANKLKAIVMQQTQLRDMIVDGLGSIASGENPRLIELKLQNYLD